MTNYPQIGVVVVTSPTFKFWGPLSYVWRVIRIFISIGWTKK